jgi:hypothetical protein
MDDLTMSLYARRVVRGSSAVDASDWAVEQLQRGRETHYLLIVAGLGRDASPWEVDHYLARAMDDLGWQPPTPEQAVGWLAADLARRILELGPVPAAELYTYVRDIARLCIKLDYTDSLIGMYSLDDDYTILNMTGRSAAEWSTDVLEEAKRIVIEHDRDSSQTVLQMRRITER